MQHHTEAIKLLQDWSKWLVGIDSAALAALTTRPGYELEAMSFATATSGMVAAVFFLISLLMANWLLLALPGVLQRAFENNSAGHTSSIAGKPCLNIVERFVWTSVNS